MDIVTYALLNGKIKDYASNVDEWLEENVDPATGYVLDRSLQMENAAAPADMVGDINDEVGDLKNTLNHKADVIYDTASGPIASFPDGADGLPVKDLTVGIEPVQDTSGGDPSPTHICPISGWNGANVWDDPVYGGNIVWNQLAKLESNYWTRSNMSLAISGTSITGTATTGGGTFKSALFALQQNHVYGIFASASSVGNNGATGIYNGANRVSAKSIVLTAGASPVRFDAVVKTTESEPNFRFVVSSAGDVGSTITLEDLMVCDLTVMFGETKANEILAMEQAQAGDGVAWLKNLFPDNYYQYNTGETTCVSAVNGDPYRLIPITFPDTAFGGVVDVTTGVMKVRPYYASYNGEALVGPWISSMDAYTPGGTPTTGAQVVDLGGAETAYTVDPATVSTLLGKNNIWADCGPVSVDYPCDTKLYIQKINTPSDDDMIADAQIASGKYFIVNNNLYLSTTTILAGDPIKPGTNCTLTDLAAALNAINS